MNPTNEACQFLQWDTDFFNYRIGRVKGHRLTAEYLETILGWCELNGIECLYFLADSDDPLTIRLAETHGFSLVEVRLTLERWLEDWDPESRPKAADDVLIRPGKPQDIPVLQDIAATSYIDSRYYFDKCFSEQKWRSFYATWVEKSFSGGADMALVAEKEGEVIGYITGNVVKGKPEGVLELTGVRESARRSGVGQELFRSALDWYVRAGIEHVSVVTQGRNITTQRMILRHGFLVRCCQLYYHKWFRECEPE